MIKVIGKTTPEVRRICICDLDVTIFKTEGCVGIEKLTFKIPSTDFHVKINDDDSMKVEVDDPAKLWDFIWKN